MLRSAMVISVAAALASVAAAVQPHLVTMPIDEAGVKQGMLVRRESDEQSGWHAIMDADGETTVEKAHSLLEQDMVSVAPVVHSCRHNTYVDAANPHRMKLGTYCVDHTDYTKAADGTVMTQEDLNKCGSKDFPGGAEGFWASVEQCPVVRSCRHATFKDSFNPNRMKYLGNSYCVDLTADTVAASGKLATRAEIDSCRQWTTAGGGFVAHKELCGGKIDATEAKCNSYTCPKDWYLRRNAPDLKCVDDECKEDVDKVRCCKVLTREATNKRCSHSQALDWFEDWTFEECVAWAANNGANFFVYGKGDKDRRCWWQRSTAPTTCKGDDCCTCPPQDPGKDSTKCRMTNDEGFDFFKLA